VKLQLVVEQSRLQRLMTAYDVIEGIDDDIDDEIVMVCILCGMYRVLNRTLSCPQKLMAGNANGMQ